MQAETTKLIIHTGAGPEGTARRNKNAALEEKTKRTPQKRHRASRDKAGKVVIYGQNSTGSNEALRTNANSAEHPPILESSAAEAGTIDPREAPLPRTRHNKVPGKNTTNAANNKNKVFLRTDKRLTAKSARRKRFSLPMRKPHSERCAAGEVAIYGRAAPQNSSGFVLQTEGRQEASPMWDPDSAGGVTAEKAPPHSTTDWSKRRAHRAKGKRRPVKPRLTFGERLLRNSAIACALLLAMLAARNIDTPWTQAAVEGVERALTMKIDLDESLGQLSFVRDLMPESMLVFFDLSNESELALPVDGELDKRFDGQQPWIEFDCEPGAEVVAAEAGTVVATQQLSGGGWGVMIEHDNGLESVSAYLLEPEVQAGERVERGQGIARSEAGRVYFEVRRNGEIIDPAALMGL